MMFIKLIILAGFTGLATFFLVTPFNILGGVLGAFVGYFVLSLFELCKEDKVFNEQLNMKKKDSEKLTVILSEVGLQIRGVIHSIILCGVFLAIIVSTLIIISLPPRSEIATVPATTSAGDDGLDCVFKIPDECSSSCNAGTLGCGGGCFIGDVKQLRLNGWIEVDSWLNINKEYELVECK